MFGEHNVLWVIFSSIYCLLLVPKISIFSYYFLFEASPLTEHLFPYEENYYLFI